MIDRTGLQSIFNNDIDFVTIVFSTGFPFISSKQGELWTIIEELGSL